MLFGDVCNFVGNFSQYFLLSGCFWVVEWFELVGWGCAADYFFCEGWKWRKCRLGGEIRMKWCRCDANEEDDFFAINNWFSG